MLLDKNIKTRAITAITDGKTANALLPKKQKALSLQKRFFVEKKMDFRDKSNSNEFVNELIFRNGSVFRDFSVRAIDGEVCGIGVPSIVLINRRPLLNRSVEVDVF